LPLLIENWDNTVASFDRDIGIRPNRNADMGVTSAGASLTPSGTIAMVALTLRNKSRSAA
jgi:hypothetical protein